MLLHYLLTEVVFLLLSADIHELSIGGGSPGYSGLGLEFRGNLRVTLVEKNWLLLVVFLIHVAASDLGCIGGVLHAHGLGGFQRSDGSHEGSSVSLLAVGTLV